MDRSTMQSWGIKRKVNGGMGEVKKGFTKEISTFALLT